jgi:two-component system, NarL family, response regulator YdfI
MRHGPTRVLIVAESDVLAATVEASLRDKAGLRIVVGRSRALGRLIEEHDPVVVVLVSTAARVASALETMGSVLRTPAVILLVDDPRGAWTSAARRAGVQAVLGSDAPPEQITAAIDAVTAGLIALHPDVMRPVPRAAVGDTGEERALTTREREILEMLAEGLSNRMIARRLGISMYTVKFHVASILGKLRAGSRTEAVTLGVRSGLISL